MTNGKETDTNPASAIKPEWIFDPAPPSGADEGGIAAFEVFKQAHDLDQLELLVRESIQNCCDARLGSGNPVHVEFRLDELGSDATRDLLTAINFDQLQPHIESVAAGSSPLADRISQTGLEQTMRERIRVMTISDHGTQGLWGEEGADLSEASKKGNFQRLIRASMKSHEEAGATSGGSFGLGKAIYWMMSGLSTVIFNSVPYEEPGANEARFIGRAWLPSHNTESADPEVPDEWDSRGSWFGEPEDGPRGRRALSVRGPDGNALATELGIERDGSDEGTSIAIIAFDDPQSDDEPSVEEILASLQKLVKRWYWPAICGGHLTVTIRGSVEGNALPAIEIDDVSSEEAEIGPFVQAWKLLKSIEGIDVLDQDTTFAEESISFTVPKRTKEGEEHETLQTDSPLGILIEDGDELEDSLQNSVALMRGSTGMVVQYWRPKSRVLRRFGASGRRFHGVILTGKANGEGVADEQLERFLRATEPPAHDRWDPGQTRAQTNYNSGGPQPTAKSSLNKAFDAISAALLSQLDEPIPEGAKASERMSRMLRFGTKGTKPPPPKQLVISRGEVTPGDRSWQFDEASFGLNNNRKWDKGDGKWSFVISVSVPEDGRRGKTALNISALELNTDNCELIDFTPGSASALIRADESVERAYFTLTAELPESASGQTRTHRVGAELRAVRKDGKKSA